MIIINMCSCDECEEKFKDGKGESKKKRRGNDLESEVNIFPLVNPNQSKHDPYNQGVAMPNK
jgi:hypothetical protein